MMLFMRDCQRGKCCTVTYDAVHEGLPERGRCCTVTYDAVHEGLPEGEMLHSNI